MKPTTTGAYQVSYGNHIDGRQNQGYQPAHCSTQSPTGRALDSVIDTGSGPSLINRKMLQLFPRVKVQSISNGHRLEISGISKGILHCTEFVNLPIALPSQDGETVRVYGEVHVVDSLPFDLLIGVNILQPNRMDIIWESPDGSPAVRTQGHFIPLRTNKAPSLGPKPRRKVYLMAAKSTLIPPGYGINLPITHKETPQTTEGYLVSANDYHINPSLQQYGRLPSCIATGQESHLPFANFGKTEILVRKGTRLGFMEANPAPNASTATCLTLSWDKVYRGQPVPTENQPSEMNEPSNRLSNENASTCLSWEEIYQGQPIPTDEQPDDPPVGAPFLVQPPDEHVEVTRANVSKNWGEDYERRVREILHKYREVFSNKLGCFNDNIKMPIPFRPDVDLSKLKQAPFPMSQRDRDETDKILNPMREAGKVKKVPLGQPSPVASPGFIVWRNGKPRFVVDLRRVNAALFPDAYPLPKQDTILAEMGGSTVFSTLDVTKGFFQQELVEEDQWKTAFVTPHRGQEMMTVSTMGLANTPGFFQHRMEDMLAEFLWKFVLVYVDDILIYSRNLEQHLIHLDQILHTIAKAGITINVAKCQFAYPSIQALGKNVSRLGLTTIQEKIEAIRNLAFPKSAADLEIALGIMGYYRAHVPHYSSEAEQLQQLKTKALKGAPPKGYERRKFTESVQIKDIVESPERLLEYELAFQKLKDLICSTEVLMLPDYSKEFILYVDGSKHGFGAALHQTDDDGKERPVLFLSKTLNPTEQRYWATELETAALIWALQKLPQYLDHNKFTVYTDHNAIVQTFKDSSSLKGKRSERLNNWRIFLAQFIGRMTVHHRQGKLHINADALSRLPLNEKIEPETQPETETVPDSLEVQPDQHADASPASSQSIIARTYASRLVDDPVFGPIYRRLKERQRKNQPPSKHGYTLQSEGNLEIEHPLGTYQCEPTDSTWQATLVHMSDTMRQAIVRALPEDRHFGKLYNLMARKAKETARDDEGPIVTRETFRYDPDSKLLYETSRGGRERLCIPHKVLKTVLTQAHDKSGHPGTTRVVDRIRETLFVPHLRKAVAEYVTSCPQCEATKPSRQLPFGELHPVEPPQQPHVVHTMDFIVSLPYTDTGFDALLTVTDPFTKWVRLVKGRTDYTAIDWAEAYYDQVYPETGLPASLISDRDPKFTSEFWETLCKRVGIALGFTTAYHPQANGQSERSNQTIEIMLRTMLAEGKALAEWDDLLPTLSYAMNTSTNRSTGMSPYLLLYGVSPRSELNPEPSTMPASEDFIKDRQQLRAEALDSLRFAQARMAQYYDGKHTAIPNIQPGDKVWLKLAKKREIGYRLPHSTALDVIKAGPYEVLRKISKYAYELQLPDNMKIHPVISIAHLEPAKKDEHNRTPPPLPPIMVDGEERYVIDRILQKQLRKVTGKKDKVVHYKVRWQGYKPKDDQWLPQADLMEQVPQMVRDFESRQKEPLSRRSSRR